MQALGDAEYLRHRDEPAGPRRAEFANAVERAVDGVGERLRVAEGLAQAHRGPPAPPARCRDPRRRPAPRAGTATERGEYTQAAEAVRRAAARGARDLRDRLRA